MRSSLDTIRPSARSGLSALMVRREINIRRSRALVASAEALVRATARPAIGNPRALRTWMKMKNGGLPTDGVRRRWMGPGHGQRCNGCGDAIAAHETEFEVDFSDALLLRFHRDSFKTWQTFEAERG